MSNESEIKRLSLQFFDEVGFAAVGRPATLDAYTEWLELGRHGSMDYLRRHLEKKEKPELLLPKAKSWIALALHYDTTEPLSIELAAELSQSGEGWIARYARGGDYHTHIARRHEDLIRELKKQFPLAAFLGCVDSQAVLERDTGSRAGLGWVGKNTCLIDQKRGSFFFLSEILTTLELEPSKPVADHCGTCTKCIDSCPTGALVAPRELDATKCISYWTIEAKNPPPMALAEKFAPQFFGCDICQDVCPWNTKARRTLPLPPAKESGRINLPDLLKLSDEEIRAKLRGTALKRAKPSHLRRNAELLLKAPKVL